MELEEAINKRKSIRKYKDEPIDLADLEKLMVAGLKVPSAGGIHPLRIHLVIDEAQKEELCKAALNQRCVREARACLVITSDSTRMIQKYHQRGYRYIFMEAGHAGQNISLMAVSLGLGCVMVGSFSNEGVKKVLETEEDSLYIIPVGRINPV
jgi:nitroreductase